MSEVNDVRAALDRLRNRCESNTGLESAIVSEGLAACDEYEAQAKEDDGDVPGFHQYVMGLRREVDVFASILRKAGLLQ